jgi:hypothetical protein
MLLAFALFLCPVASDAFCGFYVAKADTKLWNKASKVVIVRDGDRTVLTMANDYRGEPAEFAMVVPVPVVLEEGQVHVASPSLIEHLDAYTAPRLVEYFDEDPCHLGRMELDAALPSSAGAARKASAMRDQALGVTIEASYTVGEYDILILSAQQSDGLATWLRENEYRIPAGAEPILASYLKQGMRFFVAKVNLEEKDRLGTANLRPLQMAFETPRFGLPIRLGTVNGDGQHELFVYTLTRTGRVETTNYRTVRIPTGDDLPPYVESRFADFYRDMFGQQARQESGTGVFLEYAWDMAWCDPCAANPLSPAELRELHSLRRRELPRGSPLPDHRRSEQLPGTLRLATSVAGNVLVPCRGRVSAQAAGTPGERGAQPGAPDRLGCGGDPIRDGSAGSTERAGALVAADLALGRADDRRFGPPSRERELPAADQCTRGEETAQPLHPSSGRPHQPGADDDTEQVSGQESEEVGEDVHPTPGAAEHRQQSESGTQREHDPAPALAALLATGGAHPAQDADRTEDRRGGADRDVRRAPQQRVRHVASAAGEQGQREGETRPQATPDERQEQGSEEQVSDQVGEIRMQAQRGDDAPELSLENSRGVRTSDLEPDHGSVPRTGDQVEGAHRGGGSEGNVQRPGAPVLFERRRLERQLLPILPIVGAQLRLGPLEIRGIDQQQVAALARSHPTGDVDGREDELPLLDLPPGLVDAQTPIQGAQEASSHTDITSMPPMCMDMPRPTGSSCQSTRARSRNSR